MLGYLLQELGSNYAFFLNLIFEHIEITFIAALTAIIIGVLIGVGISQKPKIAGPVIAAVNVLYTIPSIALLGILIYFTGIGNTTAIIALIVYALLPIVRSTYVGIQSVDPKLVEASKALGSKPYQTLLHIELPLAFPLIFSAIRNMITMTIALAGIASFVGAGGLGVAIYRGITTNNQALLIIGSVLIALLALGTDLILAAIEKLIRSRRLRKKNFKSAGCAIIAFIFCAFAVWGYQQHDSHAIRIASKPTTEGYILAEMMAAMIRQDTRLKVNITHGVGGGTANIQPAMVKGDFDMYPEYTGTAWQVVLKHKEPYTNKEFKQLQDEYRRNYHLLWRGMFGFNNTYSIGIRREIADTYNIHSFSDLARQSDRFVFGAEYDFFEREDGYNALVKRYGFTFKKHIDMDNGLKYQSLFAKQIDAMTVFTTDGQLSDPRIVTLTDDLDFYPKYMAGIVVRQETIKEYPELEKVLAKFNGLIDEKTMAALNREVDIDKKNPRDVAIAFLKKKGLLEEHYE